MDAQVQLAPLWLVPAVVDGPGLGVGDQLEMQALASLRAQAHAGARRRVGGLLCPNCRAADYSVVIESGAAGVTARGACDQCGARGRASRRGGAGRLSDLNGLLVGA